MLSITSLVSIIWLLGVFAIHGVGGSGTVTDNGMLGQLAVQAAAVLSVLIWSGGISYLILKLLDKTLGIRVSGSDETEGLDISLHNEQGYNL